MQDGFNFQNDNTFNDFLIPKIFMFIIFKCQAILQQIKKDVACPQILPLTEKKSQFFLVYVIPDFSIHRYT